jgi:hypothetical protein
MFPRAITVPEELGVVFATLAFTLPRQKRIPILPQGWYSLQLLRVSTANIEAGKRWQRFALIISP